MNVDGFRIRKLLLNSLASRGRNVSVPLHFVVMDVRKISTEQ